MNVTTKRLDALKHPKKNVRIHSEQQIRELKRSLEKFGQTRAIVVDEDDTILIGNGLYEAMVSLGYQEATVYVKTGLSENDKKKLMIVTLVIAFQYAKHKGLEGIREQVYQLILKAEHMYKESGTGQQKLKWVVQQSRGLLPKWLQVIMSEDALLKIIDVWFCGVKDLLDDGKINGSQKEGA